MHLYLLELPISFIGAFETANGFLRTHRVDLAFCPFDRVEMLGACLAFFINNVPIHQIHAGDISGEGTLDDAVRHIITLCSDFQFCNGAASHQRTLRLLELAGKRTDHCFEVGSIQFDDLEIDTCIIPKDSFDVVIYNPLTTRPNLMQSELDAIERLLDKRTIWIYPNEDMGREIIIERIRKLERNGKAKGYESLPRPQLLALLKHCDRAIGNSSAFFLELPYFGKKHIHIGLRNKYREVVEPRIGGSDRIVKILEKILSEEETDLPNS